MLFHTFFQSDILISLFERRLGMQVGYAALFKSPNPQDWRLEVPTRSPAAGAGVRACCAPAVGHPNRTWSKRRPRGGSCYPGAKALSSGRGSAVGKTRPPSWTWETFLRPAGTAGSVCFRLRCCFHCSLWKWQHGGNIRALNISSACLRRGWQFNGGFS